MYSRGPIIRTLEIVSVIAGVCAVLALIAVVVLSAVSAHRTAAGRRFAVGVTCAVESAVSRAGYDTITKGSLLAESPFTRFLEQHGYPKRKARSVQARAAGREYVNTLAHDVVERVGARGARLIRPDGSLNCRELEKLANVLPSK